MTTLLTAEDPIYEELYDIRLEAMELGNFVEKDMTPAMSALRDRAPVQKGYLRELLGLPPHKRYAAAQGNPGYTCLSFHACDDAFRDGGERFSERILRMPTAGGERRLSFLEMDDPEHRAYRKTMQSMFLRPRIGAWWRPRWINDIVKALVADLHDRERTELNLHFCARIPVHTITRAVGMDGDSALVFRQALLKSSSPKRGADERVQAGKTVERMLLELITRRRVEPGDDVVTGLIRSELELPDGSTRPLTDMEIVSQCRLVMLAGGGTTWRQMGITLLALLSHREQLEAVKSDRSLVDVAIEESLRWNPTIPVFGRLVTRDTELEGVSLQEGSVLEICLGAANRDPNRWDNPDAYDLHRPAKMHLGFGVGPHQCLGLHVARGEMNAGLNALIDAFPNLRLDPTAPSPYLTGGLEQRGVSSLPVLLN